jgi:hypothetical protein
MELFLLITISHSGAAQMCVCVPLMIAFKHGMVSLVHKNMLELGILKELTVLLLYSPTILDWPVTVN